MNTNSPIIKPVGNPIDYNPIVERLKRRAEFEKPEQYTKKILDFLFRRFVAQASVVKGIDASHWNAINDFGALWNSGIRFIYLKVSEGTWYKDSKFSEYWKKALDKGFLVGGYHFFRANANGKDQADLFLNTIRPLVDAADGVILPSMLDSETRDGQANSTIISRAFDWLTTVKGELRKPGIYTSPYIWDNMYSPHPGWSDRFYGWVAHWTSASSPNWPVEWHPELRRFWQKGVYGTHPWIPYIGGISGRMDYNEFLGTPDELKRVCGEEDEPPPPPPPDEGFIEAYVRASALSVRSGPGLYNVIDYIYHNNKVQIYAIDYDVSSGLSWSKISKDSERWCATKWLMRNPS